MTPRHTTPTAKLLMDMYQAMHARFGHQKWWPGNGALEICVGAILTQNTNWRNVTKAIANLRSAGCMSVTSLRAMDRATLAELIRPAGYYNVKSKRLKNFIARVHEGWAEDIGGFLDRPVSVLREELMGVNGIGRETADSIILYAAGKCTFVVDAYTARILRRHRLIDEEADYDQIKDLFESNLPADAKLFNEYHALLVQVGKRHCRPRARCPGCPLDPFEHEVESCEE
jgi:endonuclease-3 related protein